ncbi:zinc ribbon domain-containing protein [Streptomyces sp. NPDC015220]|uniref:zinc ribbon domain-containing protein n=1 Tax=Streptomyces sp. NPDC015220 TaxID=3364947 RepID=UPI0036FBC6CB
MAGPPCEPPPGLVEGERRCAFQGEEDHGTIVGSRGRPTACSRPGHPRVAVRPRSPCGRCSSAPHRGTRASTIEPGRSAGRADVRTWTCGACGAVLDRDVNAAVNVAKAAGWAVTASGAQVRRASVPAPRDEAGTHPKRPTQPVGAGGNRGPSGPGGCQGRYTFPGTGLPGASS